MTLVELPGAPVDVVNARLDRSAPEVRRNLRPVCDMRRMSTFAVGAVLNAGVRRMRPTETFVNVGTWRGFSLLAGMAGNPDSRCVGVDNFSAFRGPREAFMERFERHRGPAHRFFDMDYEEYFASHHDGAIGLYFYDGPHRYKHQLRGLEVAEPYFADDCVVVVDDTSWPKPREATLDFIAGSKRDYRILLDQPTAEARHPTFWNGLIVFRAGAAGGDAGNGALSGAEPLPPSPVDFRSRETRVSLVLCNYEPDASAIGAAIEGALAQTWPSVEVVVADLSDDDSVRDAIERYGDRIVRAQGGPRAAFDASSGSLAAFADCHAPLEPFAVEAGLALPGHSMFFLEDIGEGRARRIRRGLDAAADIEAVIPARSSFVFAGAQLDLSESVDPARATPLAGALEPVEEGEALTRLDALRSDGASFAVVLASGFEWLAERPRLEARLTAGKRLVENDRVRVFTLEPG